MQRWQQQQQQKRFMGTYKGQSQQLQGRQGGPRGLGRSNGSHNRDEARTTTGGGSHLIVYEWDPVYMVLATTTTTSSVGSSEAFVSSYGFVHEEQQFVSLLNSH